MVTKEQLQNYRSVVCTFSYYAALCSLIGGRLEKGELTDKNALTDALEQLGVYKSKFLQARAGLGLPSEEEKALVAYREDFLFAKFRIRDGRFEGDFDSVEAVAGKWELPKGKVPTEDEAVRYEVGSLCLMLAGGSQSVFSALKEDAEQEEEEVLVACNSKLTIRQRIRRLFKELKTVGFMKNKRRYVWTSAWEEQYE